jgi:hypothetical protein
MEIHHHEQRDLHQNKGTTTMSQKTALRQDASYLTGLIQQIHTRADFISFVRALQGHLQQKPQEWENRDLSSFLSAMAGWVEDMDGYYQNRGESVPDPPTWKSVAEVLLASRVYE